jgi:hypothetical protein
MIKGQNTMTLYSHIVRRIKRNLILADVDVQTLLLDVAETVIITHNLLLETGDTKAYPFACKLVNEVMFEYLTDEHNVIFHHLIDGKLIIPQLEKVIGKLDIDNPSKNRRLELLKTLEKAVKNLVIISENDGSAADHLHQELEKEIQELIRLMPLK